MNNRRSRNLHRQLNDEFGSEESYESEKNLQVSTHPKELDRETIEKWLEYFKKKLKNSESVSEQPILRKARLLFWKKENQISLGIRYSIP